MNDSGRDHPLDAEYYDDADFESDIDQDQDFDEDSEDGIFAPVEKKKIEFSKGKMLALAGGAVLIGGAALAYFTFAGDKEKPPYVAPAVSQMPPPPMDVADDDAAAPLVPGVDANAEAPVVVATDNVPPDSADTDNAMPALPAPSATPDDVSAPVPSVDTGLNETPIPQPAPSQASPENAAENSVTPPPATATPAPSVVSSPAATAPSPAVTAPAPAAKVETVTAPAEADQPDASLLAAPVPAPAPVDTVLPTAKSELQIARENSRVADRPVPKTQYFDAPKGKALMDIPPPSLNPMTAPGESFIIVQKKSATPEPLRMERGDQTQYVESRLISAGRASSLGMNKEALEFYNDLYKKNPSDPRILMGRAVALQKAGETETAINAYQDVLRVQPDNPEALTNLMGLIGKTRPAYALQNLLDLRERFPNNPTVAAQLGVAYAESGNPEDGARYLKTASVLEPQNPMHSYNLAVIYDRMGKRDEAIRSYEQAIDAYSIYGMKTGSGFTREKVYDRLARLRGN